jgi:type I restriction enzyme, S subunit
MTALASSPSVVLYHVRNTAIAPGWRALPAKRLVRINGEELAETTPADYVIRYVDISSVNLYGLASPPQEMRFADAPSRARRRVRSGDTIISTVRTYLKAVAYFEHAEPNLIASTGFAVLTPPPELNARFLYYVVQGHDFISTVEAESKGVNYPAITPSEFGVIKLAIPGRAQQNAIVAFLDSKLAEIDRFVANKQRLIELLNEQKSIAIDAHVLRGVDPGRPRKRARVAYVGEIPAHWEERPAKHFMQEVDERSETGAEELLSVSHVTGVTPRSEKNVTMFMAESYEGSKLCRPGDLVINTMWAWMAALGVSRHRGIVSPSYGVYRQHDSRAFEDEYLDHLLRTSPYAAEYKVRSTGIRDSRLRLYPDQFLRIPIVCPPRSEQRKICEVVRDQTKEIDAAMNQATREIELMDEFRTTLIAEMVTGKIDVRVRG